MKNKYFKIKEDGFTLIELLLGLGIFSIIIVMVYNVFWCGINISERSESQSSVFKQARWTLNLMNNEIEQAIAYDFSNSYEDLTAFVGTEDKITFIKADDHDLKVISYYLDDPANTHVHQTVIGQTHAKNVTVVFDEVEEERNQVLVRSENSLINYLNDNKNTEEVEVLAVNVKKDGINLSYGSQNESNLDAGNVEWKEEWIENMLPLAVRIKIEFINYETDQPISLVKNIMIPHGVWGKLGMNE